MNIRLRFKQTLLHGLLLVGLLAGLLAWAGTASAQTERSYSLLVHPIFTPDQAALVYQPLIDFLNESTPYRFELRTARDFHRYWLDIRRGTMPDLVIEDAHLIALRMARHDFIPLVRAAQPTHFSLLTTDMSELDLADFIGRSISSMPAPSLGYLVLASWFTNPMQQPLLQSSAASWLDAVEIVFAMEADAAIVPHNLAARYVNMNQVAISTEFPNATLAASPGLPPAVRDAVRDALLRLHETPEHFGALHELDILQFVAASEDEYLGLERWLDWVFAGY